jgi:hypothetical protein
MAGNNESISYDDTILTIFPSEIERLINLQGYNEINVMPNSPLPSEIAQLINLQRFIFNDHDTNNELDDDIIHNNNFAINTIEHVMQPLGQRYLTCESFSELTTMPYSEMIKVDGMFIDDSCAIYSEQYEDDMSVTASGCGHCFCTGCATRWLTKHSRLCPTCRHSN